MNYTVLNSIKDVTLPTTGATAAALQNGLLTRFMSLTGTMLFCATLLVAPSPCLELGSWRYRHRFRSCSHYKQAAQWVYSH